jgi:hypothetical protein
MKPSELLADPFDWCKHASALDGNRDECDPFSRKARAFDLETALFKCYGGTEGSTYKQAVWNLREYAGVKETDLRAWNDDPETSHEILMAALKGASL